MKTTRISLIIAIAATVTVVVLHVTQLKTKYTRVQARLATQTVALEKAEADLTAARQETINTALALKRTADALSAKSAEVSAQADQIAKLNSEAEKLRNERNDAQSELAAYTVSMPSPEQVAHAANRIKSLEGALAASEEEKVLLLRRVKKLWSLLPNISGNPPIELPTTLNARVLAVDPKWRFVVLDAGEDQEMIPQAELLVSRGGKLVARLRVKSVAKNRCVADLMAGWDLLDVMEGDRAIPAYPRS